MYELNLTCILLISSVLNLAHCFWRPSNFTKSRITIPFSIEETLFFHFSYLGIRPDAIRPRSGIQEYQRARSNRAGQRYGWGWLE